MAPRVKTISCPACAARTTARGDSEAITCTACKATISVDAAETGSTPA